MPSCIVKSCKSNSNEHGKKDGITFHGIPRDPILRSKWIPIIQKLRNEENYVPSNRSVICCKHFKDKDMYSSKKGYTKLKRDACPTLEVPVGGNSQSFSVQDDVSEDTDDGVPYTEVPIELSPHDEEDVETCIETPREASMRMKLEKQTFLAQKRLRAVKSLTDKNRRLMKKNEKLSKILKELKHNLFSRANSASNTALQNYFAQFLKNKILDK